MSLRLLIDEDTQARLLVELLRADGHDVLTVSEASLIAKPDLRVLNFAQCEQRVLLTRNCDDFLILHDFRMSKDTTVLEERYYVMHLSQRCVSYPASCLEGECH